MGELQTGRGVEFSVKSIDPWGIRDIGISSLCEV